MAWLDGAWTALGLPWPTHKGRGPMSSDPEHATAAAGAADAAPAAIVPDVAAPPATPGPTAVGRLLRLLTREPVLVVSLVYALVSIMGMWSYYWFYDRLGVPILEYLQGADLFVIGLRRPDYLLIVLAVLAFMWVSVLPMRWAQRNPERAAELTTRHRWMRWLLFLPSREGKWTGGGWISVETQIALMGLLLSLQYLFVWNLTSASRVLEGRAPLPGVRLTLAGADAPLPRQAQLLGTTSAYVLVWWPDDRRVEVFPVANLARIEHLQVPGRVRAGTVRARADAGQSPKDAAPASTGATSIEATSTEAAPSP